VPIVFHFSHLVATDVTPSCPPIHEVMKMVVVTISIKQVIRVKH